MPPLIAEHRREALRRWARAVAADPRAWLVVTAFLARLLWVLLVPSRPVGDFALYREAAEHLWDQGHLDAEFVYMPGYVFLLAGVHALGAGGSLLAAKMIGVLAGTATVWASGGIANALFGRRAGLVATAVAAVWPAGIAAASVTGTDMPAAALGALAVFALVAQGPRRPWLAVALCGVALGMAAWIRAVAAPLAALSLLYWWAVAGRRAAAVARAGATVAIAFLILSPWAVRNQRLYGEFFFTDSHGGHTALVGANPNSEGTYSRSLNLMFTKGTGYRLFEPPSRHRASDRAAYALAKSWTRFEPAYAFGLVIAKADRLLTHERNLLYWPIFRQGVLDGAEREFFDAHRAAFERLSDGFWWVTALLAAAGVAICARKKGRPEPGPSGTGAAGTAGAKTRDWRPLAILAFPAALAAIYTVFFAEVRYHLAIVPLLFPFVGCAVDWLVASRRSEETIERRRMSIVAGVTVVAVVVCWSVLLALGGTLRARHRWAVSVCAYPDRATTRLCAWRRGLPVGGPSPLRGTWDGVGLRIGPSGTAGGVVASALTEIPLGPGRFRISATVSMPGGATGGQGKGAGAGRSDVAVALRVNGRIIARALSASPDGVAATLAGIAEPTQAPLRLEIEIEPAGIGSTVDGGMIWVSQLIVERF